MLPLVSSIDLATATVLGEAEGEGAEGQLAVATVIQNRIKQRFFSDGTVAGTVLYPYQFSVWNTQSQRRITVCNRSYDEAIVVQCKEAWQGSVLSPHPLVASTAAVMYHRYDMNPFPAWALSKDFVKVAKIGSHLFYAKAK